MERIEPTEPLEELVEEDILVDRVSLLDPEMSSGLKSDDEDDGARVPFEDPTGQGATGMSAREDADGL